MGFTKNQQNAIDVRDRTLLVSAAAGSGKTFTLTQRIIRSIIDDGQDLSRLLIVTFTKAAAGELKAKIAKALGEAIIENPDNDRLQEQLVNLGSANISTIDSFFMNPVRQNFEKLGLPAGVRMADEPELAPLKERLMREVLDEFFDECNAYVDGTLSSVGYSNRYTELIGIITENRSSANLLPTLCDIYSRLLTSPEGIEQLKKHADRLSKNADGDFFDTLEGKAIHGRLMELARYGANTFSLWCDRLIEEGLAPANMLITFDENKTACLSLALGLEGADYEGARAEFAKLDFGRLTVRGVTSEIIESAKKARKSISDALNEANKKYLQPSAEEMAKTLKLYSEITELLYSIIKRFDTRYRSEKLSRAICEFSDMPIFMLKLLLDENGEPSEYAHRLASSFDAVYIDEYQDVNEIQDKIFSIIGNDRRFMVGDIKQSIYGFREAEPSIFAEYRRRFDTYDSENNVSPSKCGGNTIFMSENFRCDEGVINFTNLVCSGIFSTFAESIGYTSDDDLRFAKGKPHDNYQSPKTVINVIHTPKQVKAVDSEDAMDIKLDMGDDKSAKNAAPLADEAIVVANQIADLIRNHKNADGSAIRAGDIAILVRGSSHAKPIISALSKLNIKCALSSKTELFETAEMKLLVALLETLDNPRHDMPLCHLMTANAEGYSSEFSFEDVIRIRRAADESRSLYDAVISYAEQNEDSLSDRCRSFISLIEKMRDASSRLSADKMVKSLSFSEEFSALTVSTAYTFLYDCVCKYVKSNWNSLHSFIVYFKDLMESGGVGGEPNKSEGDAVKVMTIHQSKGLEFNVCFLFGFGKQFNLSNRYPIAFNKDFGVTMKLPPSHGDETTALDRIKVRYEETPIWHIICNHIKTKGIEEEARIFYVALTRARERLYISATISHDFDEYLKELEGCADYSFEIKKSSSFIKWIMLTLACKEDTKNCYEINLYTKAENRLTNPFPRLSMAEINKNTDKDEEELARIYNAPQNLSDEERLLSLIPSKVAASKARPNMLDTSTFIPVPLGKLFSDSDEDRGEQSSDDERAIRARIELMRKSKSDFDSLLTADENPTAAEKGTAMHRFLQFCDYKSVDKIGVDAEIARLEELRFIDSRTASILDVSRLEAFFKSALYQEIQTARRVHREFHFRMFRPASEFTLNERIKKLAHDKMIFIQGSIDLVVESADGKLILCDYKTDKISAAERADRNLLINNMKEKHGEQLKQYANAIEGVFGKRPDKIYLFLLSIGACIEV